jgi:actin-related protein 9
VDTEVGEDTGIDENEGVLDVASIVAGGKMNEYLAKKEKEKQEKANAKKKGVPAPQANKPVRLPNSRLEKATFLYEDHALLDTLKNMNLNTQDMADAKSALDEGPSRKAHENGENGEPTSTTEANGTGESGSTTKRTGSIRREIEVGTERFMADGDGTVEKIADAVHRTISSIDEVGKRSDLWDQLIVCGNGSKLRGQ